MQVKHRCCLQPAEPDWRGEASSTGPAPCRCGIHSQAQGTWWPREDLERLAVTVELAARSRGRSDEKRAA